MSPTDRFGFPLGWTVDLRRTMHAFRRMQSRWTAADFKFLEGTRHLVDHDYPRAIEALKQARLDGFAANYNLAVAYRRVGSPGRAQAFLVRARRADPERYSAQSHSVHLRDVAVVVPFPITSGGMRVLLENAGHLEELGAHVTVIRLRDPEGARLDRSACSMDLSFARTDDDLAAAIARRRGALLIAGSWIDYVRVLQLSRLAPVIGFSGGDPVLNEPQRPDSVLRRYLRDVHELPVRLTVCSRFVQGIFRQHFGRESVYVPVVLDAHARAPEPRRHGNTFRVLVVAWDGVRDKGLDYAIPAVQSLRRTRSEVELVWITPQPPAIYADVPCELHIAPSRAEVAELYMTSDVLVFPSLVEGLGMPPLEAMAAHLPVITTHNGGSSEYAVDGWNCLVVPKADSPAIEEAVVRLLDDGALRRRLVENGAGVAGRYSRARAREALDTVLVDYASERSVVQLPEG